MAVASHYRKKLEKDDIKRLSKEVSETEAPKHDKMLLTETAGSKETRTRRLQSLTSQGSDR
jgi:hypothetical protein